MTKWLAPTTFFPVLSLAAVEIVAGIYLARAEGKFVLTDPRIPAAGIIVFISVAQGFGVLFPNGVRTFLELAKAKPDPGLISQFTTRNARLAPSQAFFQVLTILVMAHPAFYWGVQMNVSALTTIAAFAGAILLVFGLW